MKKKKIYQAGTYGCFIGLLIAKIFIFVSLSNFEKMLRVEAHPFLIILIFSGLGGILAIVTSLSIKQKA